MLLTFIVAIGVFVGISIGWFTNIELSESFVGIGMEVGLFLIMLVGMLKIKLKDISKEFKNPGKITAYILIQMVILPVAVFYGLKGIVAPDFLTSLVIYSALPAPVAAPGLLLVFKGNYSLGLIVSVLTNLLTPFIYPFIIKFLLAESVDFDVLQMSIDLAIITIGPLIVSRLINIYLPKLKKHFVDKAQVYLGVILFFFLLIVAIPYAKPLINDWQFSLRILQYVLLSWVFLHILSAVIKVALKDKNIVTPIIIFAYYNVALGILISVNYFGFTEVMFGVIYDMIWGLGLMTVPLFFTKKKA